MRCGSSSTSQSAIYGCSKHVAVRLLRSYTNARSCQLLFDEERPQVRELPRASDTEYNKLNQSPLDRSRVSTLALISELVPLPRHPHHDIAFIALLLLHRDA